MIKNCPYCGSKAKLVQRLNGVYDIGCTNMDCFAWTCTDKNCNCSTDGYVKRKDVITDWNRRV